MLRNVHIKLSPGASLLLNTSLTAQKTNIFFFFLRFYLFIFRQKGREGEIEGEKHQCVVVFHTPPPPGTWPTTQACAPTGNRTSDPLVCRPALNPLSQTSQGCTCSCWQVRPNFFPKWPNQFILPLAIDKRPLCNIHRFRHPLEFLEQSPADKGWLLGIAFSICWIIPSFFLDLPPVPHIKGTSCLWGVCLGLSVSSHWPVCLPLY